MAIHISKWDLCIDYGVDPESYFYVDLTQTPDTVLFGFESFDQQVVNRFFESSGQQTISELPKPLLHHWELFDPPQFQVDTAEVPDTVFFDWGQRGQHDVFFQARDRILDPGTTVFAGDMGAYIG